MFSITNFWYLYLQYQLVFIIKLIYIYLFCIKQLRVMNNIVCHLLFHLDSRISTGIPKVLIGNSYTGYKN